MSRPPPALSPAITAPSFGQRLDWRDCHYEIFAATRMSLAQDQRATGCPGGDFECAHPACESAAPKSSLARTTIWPPAAIFRFASRTSAPLRK